MSFPYPTTDIKTEKSLNSDLVTIDNEMISEITAFLPDSLQEHRLDVVFTTPKNIQKPKVVDVCGVHIINLDEVVICERTGLKGLNREAFISVIDTMVDSLKDKSYIIEILHKTPLSSDTVKISANGIHIMEAVTQAFNYLLREEKAEESIEADIEQCLVDKASISIEINSSSIYTLVSVTEELVFSGHHVAYIYEPMES